MKNIWLWGIIALVSACGTQKAGQEILWVNSYTQTGAGVGPRQCLLTQTNDTIDPAAWQMFYNSIEGFDYQSGYLYKLSVKKEELDPKTVPADASTLKYTLVKVMEKQEDLKLRLNDIWLLTKIKGAVVEAAQVNTPQMEIHLRDGRIHGNDGCNSFNGAITQIGQKELRFGPIAATKKFCVNNMELPKQFHAALAKVQSYSIQNNSLALFNAAGDEVLTFKKVD